MKIVNLRTLDHTDPMEWHCHAADCADAKKKSRYDLNPYTYHPFEAADRIEATLEVWHDIIEEDENGTVESYMDLIKFHDCVSALPVTTKEEASQESAQDYGSDYMAAMLRYITGIAEAQIEDLGNVYAEQPDVLEVGHAAISTAICRTGDGLGLTLLKKHEGSRLFDATLRCVTPGRNMEEIYMTATPERMAAVYAAVVRDNVS